MAPRTILKFLIFLIAALTLSSPSWGLSCFAIWKTIDEGAVDAAPRDIKIQKVERILADLKAEAQTIRDTRFTSSDLDTLEKFIRARSSMEIIVPETGSILQFFRSEGYEELNQINLNF